MALMACVLVGLLAGVSGLRAPVRVHSASPGHMIDRIPIAAAGVVPYAIRPDGGVHFLLQFATNGTRAGKLCDFGGRRERSDVDAYETAARELCEETDGIFGDLSSVAARLRKAAHPHIVNRPGRYACFFLKVDYEEAHLISTTDCTKGRLTTRSCRSAPPRRPGPAPTPCLCPPRGSPTAARAPRLAGSSR
jgi:hypothetical protein